MLSMEALMLSELRPQRSARALAACSLMPEASACRMIASRASCSTPFARSISPLLKPVLSPCLRIFSAAFWALLAMSSNACLVLVPCSENRLSRFPLWSNTTPLSLQVSDSSPIFWLSWSTARSAVRLPDSNPNSAWTRSSIWLDASEAEEPSSLFALAASFAADADFPSASTAFLAALLFSLAFLDASS